jgi:hypothetical protein
VGKIKKSEELANRLEEVLLNGTWIANTNYRHQLMDISWQQAITKHGTLNSIAALTFHVNYYLAGILEVLDGGDLTIKDKYSFDMPAIEKEEEWQLLKSTFLDNSQKFIEAVSRLPDDILDQDFTDKKYGSYHRNIEGVIEHCYYHLGQVSLVRKLVEGGGLS